jgi:hypothetical protein
MQAGTVVLSQDPSLKKKKIMSHWIGVSTNLFLNFHFFA